MVMSIDEVIVPQRGKGLFYSLSPKSYMMSYAVLSNGEFIFKSGEKWSKGVYGEPFYKMRGVVVSGFTEPVRDYLMQAITSLFSPDVNGLRLV